MTFKKVLSFFLTGATALSMTTAAFASDDTVIMLPADVASQDWYAPAVRYVMEYDLMDVGHPENGAPVFEPSRTVSRQEVADAIYRAACRLSENSPLSRARAAFPAWRITLKSVRITTTRWRFATKTAS